MSRNKAKKQAHSARMRTDRAAKGANGFKMLMGSPVAMFAAASSLRSRSSKLNIDADPLMSTRRAFSLGRTSSPAITIANAVAAHSKDGVLVIDLDPIA